METNHESSGGTESGGEGSAEMVEIKIKTLDSKSYTLRVGKNMPVPALKEQLASVVGVPADNQRLICRGKVLKDDQLLSAYNVEDGHTLHLVARPTPPPATVGPSTSGAEGSAGVSDAALAPPRNRAGHVSHSLLMGTINIPDNGEGGLPDLNRIISAVLNSVGIANVVPVHAGAGNPNSITLGVLPGRASEAGEGQGGEGGPAVGEQGTGARELELQIDALYGIPSNAAAAAGPAPFRVVQQPMVVPDALTTMSQYLDRLEQAFASHDTVRPQTTQVQPPREADVANGARLALDSDRRLPTPAALGALVRRVHHLLNDQAGSALAHLADQLENEPTLVDAAARGEVQSAALRDGNMMHQIGALLLELGRTTLTLRMGQSSAESVVNAGPAIFISPAGPNPMMVQPVPFQTLGALPVGTPQPPGGVLGPSPGVGGGPRSINIHIHTNDLGHPSASPSPSPSSSPQQPPPRALVGISSGTPGITMRQILERTDNGGVTAAPAPDPGLTVRQIIERAEAATGTTTATSPAGVQGALMTFDEHGAMRLVPVRARTGALPGHPRAPSEGGNIFHPLLSRFQHQLSARPSSAAPPTVPPVPHPVVTATAEISRQPGPATDNQPGVAGEGGLPGQGGGGVDVASLVTSVAPFLHHLAEAFQQAQSQLPHQESNQQPSTEADVRQAEDSQLTSDSVEGGAQQLTGDLGGASMEVDGTGGDNEIAATSARSFARENSQAEETGGTSGASGVTPPVGLGLGGLQPLPARARRRRQQQQQVEEQQRQAGQTVLHNLVAQLERPSDTSSHNRRIRATPVLNSLLRAAGGHSDSEPMGGGVLGQLMRSPAIETLVQQVMDGVGEAGVTGGSHRGTGAGGLSGLMEHMMPVMSQMLGGGGPPPLIPPPAIATSSRPHGEGGAAGDNVGVQATESERWKDALTEDEVAGWTETMATDEEQQQSMPPQRPFSDVYSRGSHVAKRQKTEMEATAQKLENGEAAKEVVRSVAEAATARVPGNNGATNSNEDLAQQVAETEGLADAYMAVLFHDLAARVAADLDFGDGSRFPHAARIFQHQSQASTQPTGGRH